MILPLSWSWMAPATISDADADPESISTIIGISVSTGSRVVRYSYVEAAVLPLEVTARVFFGRKIERMSTASPIRPPPFPRRSSTNLFIPAFLSSVNLVRTSVPTFSVNPLSSRYPVVSSSIAAYWTSGRWILSRNTGTSRVSPVRAFLTVNMTVVPGFPFILSVLSLISRSLVSVPSIAMISSPQTSPALVAGEPAYGSLMITLLPFGLWMMAPIPPYEFDSIIWRSSFSS